MASLVEDLQERTAALRAPIPGDKAGGEDASFEPDFERVKGEIDKLTGLSGAQPNWRDVIDGSTKLLSSKSKDLRLATWSAVGKMNQAGWLGLAEGLTVYHALVKDFWESMYPEMKRARGRANLHTWLGDQVAAYFEPKEVSASDGEAVTACDQLLNDIDSVLAEKLGDLYPGPGKLRGLMRDKVRAIPAVEEAPPPPPPVESSSSSSSSSPARESRSSSTADIPAATSAGDALGTVEACARTIMEAATLMRKANPAHALAYRLHRVALWITLDEPPSADGNQTYIPSPREDILERVRILTSAQNWMDLLDAAEETTGEYLFWLDMHRTVAQSMDRLGALFIGAREVVGREVVAFVSRFPSLPSLTFSDGTPFADAVTQTWLEEEQKKYGGGGGGGGSGAASAEDEEIQKRFEEAKALVLGGKVPEGLGLAAALANRAQDARMRFRAHLNVAKLAIDGGKPEVARPILESLQTEIDRHGLETWEPSVCATLYAYLYTSLKANLAEKTPEQLTKEDLVFDKLCRLDPATALKFTGA